MSVRVKSMGLGDGLGYSEVTKYATTCNATFDLIG